MYCITILESKVTRFEFGANILMVGSHEKIRIRCYFEQLDIHLNEKLLDVDRSHITTVCDRLLEANKLTNFIRMSQNTRWNCLELLVV